MQYATLMLRISEHDGRIAAELRPPPPHPPLPPPPPKSSPRASTSARYAALASAVSRDGLAGLNSTLGARDDLLLTFGSVSLASFVTNWVESLRGAGEWRLLVGALDDELLGTVSHAGAPAVRIGGGEVGGGAYFRKDYEVFKKMGARKVGFLAALADAAPAGIWVCDADMVWLRPPPAELVHRAALAGGDVLLSTDCLDLRGDERGECGATANFNTGVLFVRKTARARRFLGAWAAKMEAARPEPWLDDQAVFNELVRDGFAQSGGGASRLYSAAGGTVTVGLLPLSLVANGHTFFVQHRCAFCQPHCECDDPLPLAVHTTYQYGDAAEFAYGKRARLQQAGLWRADDGGGAAERFLAVREPPRLVGAAVTSNHSAALVAQQRDHEGGWRRRVISLLALAIATNRTLVLPAALCYCDLNWAEMRACRVPGAEAMPLPFECPIDHLLELPAWHRQTLVRWRPPRYLRHSRRITPASVQRVAFARSGAHVDGDTLWLPAGRDDAALRTALSAAGADAAEVLEVDPDTLDGALCGFAAAERRVAFAAEAPRLLRFPRLFCVAEGAAAGVVHGAPCCTRFSMATGWMEEGDPRGNGHFPCAWSARAPGSLVGADGGGCAAVADDAASGGASAWAAAEVRRVAAPSDGVLLATCVPPLALEASEAEAELSELRNWHASVVKAGAGARATVLSGSKRVSALCAELGVAHVQLPAASGGWAAAAAACAAFGAAWIEHEGRSLVLASPHVVWLRDPAPFVECAQPTADGGADGGVESLECAPVAPADALVATEMLSVKQDALFGAGFAKWGALDPSVLVLRASAGGRAFASAWQSALETEAKAAAPRGWAERAGALLRSLVEVPGAAWPGLTELPTLGVRQNSRLFEALGGRALLGVLPAGGFAHGHAYLVQRVHSRLGVAPFCVRPQLAPLPTSPHESAAARRLRLDGASLWLAAAAPPARPRLLLLDLQLPELRPPPADAGGAAWLVAHVAAVGHQLRALRDGLGAARALGRELAVPPLRCYCDRAPSGAEPLLRLGCRLPSAESEAYLPFACAPDHLLRADAWADDASAGGARLRSTESVRRWRLPERRVGVHPCAPAGAPPAADGPTTCAGATGEQLARALSKWRDAPVLELPWRAERRPFVRFESVDAGAALDAEAAALLGGPAGGWCAPCGGACDAALPAEVRAVAVVDGERFCLDFGKLLRG